MKKSCLQVYCEMSLNEGGYTFVKPVDLKRLTNAEIQAVFTDTSSFLLRTTHGGATQKIAVLEQLTQYE